MTERDRPPGLAPRGSSAGFGIVMLYWIAVPALACMALMPFGRTVFVWLMPALLCPAVGLAVVLPMAIGFRSRRFWGVRLFFWGGVAAVALLGAALAVVGVALAASAVHPPPLVGLTWAVGALLLGLAALLPFPIRALRLRYWQPAADPSSWERGDERIPDRVVRALGGRR